VSTAIADPQVQLAHADWDAITADLDASGCAVTPGSSPRRSAATWPACTTSRTCSGPPSTWTPRTRHRFGSGQYRYFTHDLPEPVRALREACYPHLLTIARSWAGRLGRPAPWPDTLDEWLAMCHQGGQSKSAQILLRYPRPRLPRRLGIARTPTSRSGW
jgi:uncharacterized protein